MAARARVEIALDADGGLDGLVHGEEGDDEDGGGGRGGGAGEVEKEDGDAEGADEFDDGAGGLGGADDAHVMADVTLEGEGETVAHDVFKVVGLDDAIAGEGLRA